MEDPGRGSDARHIENRGAPMTTRRKRAGFSGVEISRGGFLHALPRRPRRRPIYNLFRRIEEPDLVCAVPNDFPVPAFLAGGAWSYAGSVCAASEPPPGFRAEMAEHGAETCGFHLFHQLPAAVSPPRRRVTARAI